jgi:hypothetical protein
MMVEHLKMDQVQPVLRTLDSDANLKGQFDAWQTQRGEFNKRLAKGDPQTVKEAWQRFYFKGEIPEDLGAAPEGLHVNKRRLKPVRTL